MRRAFENDHFVAVDKPSLFLTTPSRDKCDPRPCLGLQLQEQIGRQIYPVHRLDYGVSGLVLFAKTAAAHRVSQRWFEAGDVLKTYLALSAPAPFEPPLAWVEWTSRLLRGKKRAYESPAGKLSRTRARVVDVASDRWLWELMPLTGRPHQLRFEMAKHGVPIVGDELYGGAPEEKMGLRAVVLDFSQISEAERLGLPQRLEVGRQE